MSILISNTSQNQYAATAAAARSSQVQKQTEASEKTIFDSLKEAFPGVNFVTNRDPLAGKNASARPTDTVYLDAAALRKLENDPKYAAYVFSEIQTSLTYAKGYTLNQGNRVTVKLPGAQTLSFYGKTETSSGASSSASYSYTATGKSSPGIFSLLQSQVGRGGNAKAYNSFRQLSNAICATRNEAYRKWAGAFQIPEGEGYYVNADEVWQNAQKIMGNAGL